MQNKWIVAHSSVIGVGHIKHNLPCQDSHCFKRLEQDWLVAIVSDGAGSCEFSHIGSGKVIDFSLKRFTDLIESQNWVTDNTIPQLNYWKRLAQQTIKLVYDDLLDFSKEEDYEFKSLSATFIIVIYSPLGLLVAHIGDGRAGYRDVLGKWKSMITPFKGQYANETCFITSIKWEDNFLDKFIEVRIIDEPINAFVLMSDGCENICYEMTVYDEAIREYKEVNKPAIGFFEPISQALINLHSQNKTDAEINKQWEEYLTNGTSDFETETDDKTMILAIKI